MAYEFSLSELENSEEFLQSPPEIQRALSREFISQNGPDDALKQYNEAIADPEFKSLEPDQQDLFKKSYSDFYGIDLPLEDVSFGTDIKDVVLSGLAGTSSIPKAAATVAGWFGADGSKEALLDIAKTTEDFYKSGISKQGKAVENQKFLSDKEGQWFGDNAIKKVFMVSAESLPLMIATAPLGGGASAAISKAKFLPQFIRAVEGGSKAGKWSHNLITYGASEAGTSALVSAADAGEKIAKMPESVIAKSPVYQELLKQGMDPAEARAELRGIVEEETVKTQFAATLAGSALSPGGAMTKLFQKGKAGIVKEGVEGVVSEGLQEAGQSGLEQAGENLTTQRNIDPLQSLTENVGEATALGAASGGLMGGGMGAGSKLLTVDEAQQIAKDIPLGADPEETAKQIETATNPTGAPQITLGELTSDEIEGIAATQQKLSTADAAEIQRIQRDVLPLIREKNPLVAPHIERIVTERAKALQAQQTADFERVVPKVEAELGAMQPDLAVDDLMDDLIDSEVDVQDQADIRGRSVRFERLKQQMADRLIAADELEANRTGVPSTAEQAAEVIAKEEPTEAMRKADERAKREEDLKVAFGDGNAMLPRKVVDAIVKMEHDLKYNDESGNKIEGKGNDSQVVGKFKSTNPDWFKAENIKKYDEIHGTNYSGNVTKETISRALEKVRSGVPLVAKNGKDGINHQRAWEYIQKAAEQEADADPDIAAGREFSRLEGEGFDFEAPKNVAVGSLEKGDEIVVIGKNGIPDKLTHKGRDDSGNIVLQDGVRMEVDEFDQVEVVAKKTKEVSSDTVQANRNQDTPKATKTTDTPGTPQPAQAGTRAVAEEAEPSSPAVTPKVRYEGKGVGGHSYTILEGPAKGATFTSPTTAQKDIDAYAAKAIARFEPPAASPPAGETRGATSPGPLSSRSEVVSNAKSIANGEKVNLKPTEKEKSAENYKTAKVNVDGLNLSVENTIDSIRSGKDEEGRPWSNKMTADYARILGSKGFDKDHVDIFVSPGYKGGAENVFVINQYDKKGKFNEHKAVIGIKTEQEALDLYNSNYEKGWTGGKSVTRVPLETFKKWVSGVGPSKGPLVRRGTLVADGKKQAVEPVAEQKKKIIAKAHGGKLDDTLESITVQSDRNISKETTFNENLYVYLEEVNSQQMRDRMGVEKVLGKLSHDNVTHTVSQYGGWRVLYRNDKQEIVGVLQGVVNKDKTGLVSNAYVRPDFRRKGIGRILAREAERRFKKLEMSGDNSISGADFVDAMTDKGGLSDTLEAAAFHGSPHSFDKFSTEKIGTGEGAQAYGFGLYFSSSRDVADWYKNKLSDTIESVRVSGVEQDLNELAIYEREILNSFEDQGPGFALAQINRLLATARRIETTEGKEKVRALSFWEKAIRDGKLEVNKPTGRLYQVELAPSEDEYLLWDKPLSEQSEKVKAALVTLFRKEKSSPDRYTYLHLPKGKHGSGIYREMSLVLKGDESASKMLHKYGIRGIKYLDGTSRGKGDGNYNYVIFSGQDVTITDILESPTTRRQFIQQGGALIAWAAAGGDIVSAAPISFNEAVRADGQTVHGLLKHIKANSSSERFRTMAEDLLALLPDDAKVDLAVSDAKMNAAGIAKTDRKNKRVSITLFGDGHNEATLLHEAWHAAVLSRYDMLNYYLANPGKFGDKNADAALKQYRAVWEEFRREVEKQSGDVPHWLRVPAENPDEFLTYALTNQETIDWMATHEYRGKTLRQRFIEAIRGFFNRMFRRAPTWLEAANMAAGDLVAAMKKDAPNFEASARILELVGKEKTDDIAKAAREIKNEPAFKKWFGPYQEWSYADRLSEPNSLIKLIDDLWAGKYLAKSTLHPVQRLVLGLANNDKIGGEIISLFPVNVVNRISGKDISSDNNSGDFSMFINALNSPISNKDVAALTGPMTVFAAELRRSLDTGADKINSTAMLTSDFSLPEISGLLAFHRLADLGGGDFNIETTGAGQRTESPPALSDAPVSNKKNLATEFANLLYHHSLLRRGLNAKGIIAPLASQVKDENGDPLVVYHGGPKELQGNAFRVGGGNGIFFAGNKRTAKIHKMGVKDGAVHEVYLSIKNPHEVDYRGTDITRNNAEEAVRDAKANGHDGVIIRNFIDIPEDRLDVAKRFGVQRGYIGDVFIAFEPTQIKSILNTKWDGTNPDILESALYAKSPATSTQPDRIDRFLASHPALSDLIERTIYGVIDTNDPRRRVLSRAQVVNMSENLSENTDILTIERLRGKKTAEESLRFWEDKVVPLLKRLATAKLAPADLDEYSHAMHAPERNKRMQQVNAKGYIDRIAEHLNSAERQALDDEIIDIRSDVLMTGGTRADRQDRYLQVLDGLMAGVVAQRADLAAEQQTLDNRQFTAAEIAKGTPDNLQKRLDSRAKHLDEIEKIRDRWELESPRFAGITDQEASDIVTRWQADPRFPALQAAHATLLEFGQQKLDILRESGQLTDVEYRSLVDGYQYYVPLHRDVETDDRPATGRVTGPTGSPIKVAKGSMLEVVHILAHSIQNVQTAINRKHKADAGRVLLNFAKENPDAGITVGKQKKEPRHDSEGNIVMYTASREADNELYIRVDGERYTLTFDTKNATTKRFLQSIKDADANLSGPIRALGALVRVLAMVNTTLSPEFIISNFTRDIQTAGIHMQDTEAKGLQGRVLKNVFPAIKGILGAEYGKADTHWGRIYRDFAKNGGKIGWMQSYDGIKDLASQIESTSDLYREGHVVKKSFRAIGDMISRTNTAVENGVRLAFYDQMIKAGATPSRAALAASNLTVDFTRRGSYSPAINALYMFFNAGVQGNVRMIKAIGRSPGVRVLAGGVVLTGFALQFLAYATGGDDETGQPFIDGIPDFIRERNMIFMKGDGKYFKVPMPYGYNGFFNIGAEIARAIHDNATGRKYEPGKGAMRVVNTLLGTFNPLQSATVAQALSPTVLDPFVMVAENKTWSGNDLMPKESPFGPNKADAYRAWKSTSPTIKSIAQGLHRLTGGKGEYDNKAAVDVSPETIEMMYETFTGSAGRFVKDMVVTPIQVMTSDEPVDPGKVPFVRKVYGEWSPRSTANRYYEQAEQVERFRKDYIAATPEMRKELSSDPRYKMVRYTRETEKALDKLREYKNKAEAAGRPTKLIEEKILQIQTEYLKRGTL